MKSIERRLSALEKETQDSETVIINVNKTIIGDDAEVERVEKKTIRMN